MTMVHHASGEGGDFWVPDEHAPRLVKTGRWALAAGEVMPKIVVQPPAKTSAAPGTSGISKTMTFSGTKPEAKPEVEQKKGAAAGDEEED